MIFLYLHKVCDSLDRGIFLDILEGYRVGSRACRILRAYWDRLAMVSIMGGYYGEAFQGLGGG